MAKPNHEIGYVHNNEPAIFLGISPEEMLAHIHQKTGTRIFLAKLFIKTKPGKDI